MTLTHLLFSFEGRINRKTFWIFYILISIVVAFAVTMIVFFYLYLTRETPSANAVIGMTVAPLGSFICTISAKRLHDRGRSAWWIVPMYLLPPALEWLQTTIHLPDHVSLAGAALLAVGAILSIFALVDLGFLPGEPEPNVYGAGPEQVTI